jgi:hypothetical protein
LLVSPGFLLHDEIPIIVRLRKQINRYFAI